MPATPVIPEYITVHLGKPSEDAENVTVPFVDYIKNVASSEIYPTWPDSALRANIYAQISFALNRVYLEYYRSRGYDFDITNSTAYDQAFVRGRDVFENISQIVDGIFNDYVVRQGSVEPLFTEYCDGKRVTCAGMSQWGTVELANRGYTPYQILQNYYGDDINIVNDAPVRGIKESLPREPLKLGSAGDDVRQLQIRLNRISKNYPAIPKINPVSSVYERSTEDAVRTFQEIFSLMPDGIVGRDTWYKIQLVYNSVKKLSELDSEGLTQGEVSGQYSGVLSRGDKGYGVRAIQYMLLYVSRFDDSIPPVEVDGVFGPLTEQAVKAFQDTYGLKTDGIVGENTYYKLYDVYRGMYGDVLETEEGIVPYPGYALTEGQEGEYVRVLQTYLNYIAQTYNELPTLPVTGIFGQRTRESVADFQRLFDIDVLRYGVAGVETWRVLTEVYRELKESRSVGEGQYPGYVIS